MLKTGSETKRGWRPHSLDIFLRIMPGDMASSSTYRPRAVRQLTRSISELGAAIPISSSARHRTSARSTRRSCHVRREEGDAVRAAAPPFGVASKSNIAQVEDVA